MSEGGPDVRVEKPLLFPSHWAVCVITMGLMKLDNFVEDMGLFGLMVLEV